jgi:tRNA (cytidine/uridine-2'-O-)-methyltransferase
VFHVILLEPEIPPNTGNIIRLCANTGCALHLVGPLGFSLDRRSVRRAGLDYAELATLRTHASLDACIAQLPGLRLHVIDTGLPQRYDEAVFRPGDGLLFGPETRGLPATVRSRVAPELRLSIPMQPGNRSLNLSNAVAVVVYEAWRQNGFRTEHTLSRTPA